MSRGFALAAGAVTFLSPFCIDSLQVSQSGQPTKGWTTESKKTWILVGSWWDPSRFVH